MEFLRKELNNYILKFYGGYMTAEERFFINQLAVKERILQIEQNEGLPKEKKQFLISKMKDSLPLPPLGYKESSKHLSDEMINLIVDRILKDHRDEIVINKCPICGRMAGTPTTKRGKCGHNWD